MYFISKEIHEIIKDSMNNFLLSEIRRLKQHHHLIIIEIFFIKICPDFYHHFIHPFFQIKSACESSIISIWHIVHIFLQCLFFYIIHWYFFKPRTLYHTHTFLTRQICGRIFHWFFKHRIKIFCSLITTIS